MYKGCYQVTVFEKDYLVMYLFDLDLVVAVVVVVVASADVAVVVAAAAVELFRIRYFNLKQKHLCTFQS